MAEQIAKRVAHTEGPWSVDGQGCRLAGVGDVTFAGYVSLVPITAPCVSAHYEPSDDEREANARLIAATPRLFDALKGLVGLVQLLPDADLRVSLQRNHRYVEALEALAEASESEHA